MASIIILYRLPYTIEILLFCDFDKFVFLFNNKQRICYELCNLNLQLVDYILSSVSVFFQTKRLKVGQLQFVVTALNCVASGHVF